MKKPLPLPSGRLVAAAILAIVYGCDRVASPREIADRANRNYQLAMTDFETDHFDAAVKGFRKVISDQPANAAAHFQLATILLDHEKKYVEALAHLKIYLALRPHADKVPVAETMAKRCEELFAAEAVARAGVESKLAKELEKVKNERDALVAKLAETGKALDAAQKSNATLAQDMAVKKRIFSGLAEKDADAKSGLPAALAQDKSILDEAADDSASQPRKLTDADLLDDEPTERTLDAEEVKSMKALIEAEDEADLKNEASRKIVATNAHAATALPFAKKTKKPAKPERPATYVVQPGERLMEIAKRFYGSKEKWRDIQKANRLTVSPDGRVNAGVELKLP